MNMKRKNYSTVAMAPNARGNDRSVSLDGVYNNSLFMNSVTELIGNVIKVHTSTGAIYEGIFRTFSAEFEIVLELAHKIDLSNPSYLSVDSIVDTIIFRAEDTTLVEIVDADMEYATRNAFQTDTVVSKFNGQVTEKELEPWDCSGSNADDFELDRTTSNGWDVNEMFRRNEQMYGVTSNFDHGLSAYTTPLPNKDSKYYKDAEAKAAKIASEIESNPVYKARIDMENGDEEEKYAAVVRPSDGAQSMSEGSKYVCPPKRKSVQQGVKPFRTPQVMSNVASPQSSGGNESSPKLPPPTVNVSQHDGPPAHGATSSVPPGERVNGTTESPRPQRPPINPRYARSFSSNEIIRHNGGSQIGAPIRSNSVNNSVMEIRNPPHSSTHNSNNSNYSNSTHPTAVYSSNGVSSSSESYHHRKPPPIIQSDYQTTLSVPRKAFKGRDAQTIELKKFGAEFKLNENAEDKKPNMNQPTNEPTNSHATTGNDKSEQKSEVSSTPRTSDVPEGKILNSTLNPNAKEFVYNPTAKPFTPRSATTSTNVTTGNTPQPRPPQGYGGPAPPIQTMVMPTYVVTTSQPPYSQQPQQTGRYRKVPMGGISQPSQMQVASVTGQPLLAPAPMHAQFAVPYPPQAIPPQQYQQMVRMVAQQAGGMGPPVLTAINYPPDGSAPQMQYIQGPAGIGPYHPYHVHSAQNNASSPQATSGASSAGGSGGSNGGDWTNGGHPHSYPASSTNSYSQPPPGPGAGPPNPPPYSYPMLCPMLPAAPPPSHSTSHNPHHMMQGAPTSYIHHHPHQHSSTASQQQGSHIQVILPPHNQ